MDKKLYAAYGSNLHLAQMAHRSPTARVVGASAMNGWRLLFRGAHGGAVATVEPQEGGSVPVLVWAITPADEAALDRYEGYPYLYRKETVEVELNGETASAMVYIMNADNGRGGYRPLNQPDAYYYSIILDGYKDAGFDADILRQATVDSVEAETEPLITETLKEQIRQVQRSGKANMLDIYGVQRAANDENLYELVIFIEEHRKEYTEYILGGGRGVV